MKHDYTPLLDPLKKYAQFLTRNHADADDLLQDTFVRLIASDSRFDGKNMLAWSVTIMRNRFYSLSRTPYRTRRRALPATYQEPAAPYFDPVELREAQEALSSLTQDARTVLLLRAQGYMPQEIAPRLRIPVGTVKSRTNRARAALRQALDMPIYPHSKDKEAP